MRCTRHWSARPILCRVPSPYRTSANLLGRAGGWTDGVKIVVAPEELHDLEFFKGVEETLCTPCTWRCMCTVSIVHVTACCT